MPDLGHYAFEVGVAYVVSLLLIVGLVAISLMRAARVRRQLQQVEGRQGRADG